VTVGISSLGTIDWMALAAYMFAMSITPGPNNVMLATSGVNFGFARTLPHMVGISLGFGLQAVLVSLGLGAVFAAVPHLQDVLSWVGAAYLCWLGWKLIGAGQVRNSTGACPLRAWESAGFQFVNPKAWVMAISVGVLFLPRAVDLATALPLVFVVLVMVNFPCLCVWTLFGEAMRGFLAGPKRRLAFNLAMAAILLATAVSMVWSS
jgi:threonine/homoserine/homoserine lactone efflux protein